MKIRFTNGNEIHVERGIGEALIAGGMASLAPDAPDAPKVITEKCELAWTIGHRSDDDKVSVLRYSCPVCKIHGGGTGIAGAKQLAEKPPIHRGVKVPPPKELVSRAFGHPASLLGAATMVSMREGYSGSTRPWEWTIGDQEAKKQGKSPDDRPAAGIPQVYLGDING